MTESAQHVISEFRALPEAERQEVAVAILRETLTVGYDAPDDDALILAADAVFLDLERRESE